MTKQKSHIRFVLNGEPAEVAFAPHKTLLEVLREDLNLTGTKHGCELGECGTCTVLVDGRAILSCLMLGLDAEGREVTTIEGMTEDGRLHPLGREQAAGVLPQERGVRQPALTDKSDSESRRAPTRRGLLRCHSALTG